MCPVLIAYSTTDGHTLQICERLQEVLQQHQVITQIIPLAKAQGMDLSLFGTLVIGASIRYGKHQKELYCFVEKHAETLHRHPNVFFSVNVVARKPNKRSLQTNPYVRKFLSKISWKPQHVAIFAGKIDYPRYRWLDQQAIRLIMMLTGGPTDTNSCTDFTDWSQVDALGQQIVELQLQWQER